MVRKTSISQRWEEDFVREVRELATRASCSITQFTIDGITLLGELLSSEEIRLLGNAERIEYIRKSIDFYEKNREIFTYGKPKNIQSTTDTYSNSGKTLLERVKLFLIQNPNQDYSTNKIAEIFNSKQSTIRTYLRKIKDDDDRFEIIEGRPNKITFHQV
jgi:hypothetical protein